MIVYGLDELQLTITSGVMDEMGIMCLVIGDDVLDETVSSLLEKQEDFSGRHSEFDIPYLIADGMNVNELVQVLNELKKAGAEFDGIKIMRTEMNASWTLRYLFSHTREEHETAKKAVLLDELIRSCNGIDLSSVEPAAQALLKDRLMKAYLLLKSRKFNNEMVTRAIDELTESLKGIRKLYN